jgi:hypothetical protein
VDGLPWLTHADFADRVGDRFEAVVDAGPRVPLTLAQAVESPVAGGTGPDGTVRMQFALEFRGPLARALPQGTVSLVHEGLGTLDVFLVPLGPRADEMRYEAVFA